MKFLKKIYINVRLYICHKADNFVKENRYNLMQNLSASGSEEVSPLLKGDKLYINVHQPVDLIPSLRKQTNTKKVARKSVLARCCAIHRLLSLSPVAVKTIGCKKIPDIRKSGYWLRV
ncbi:MAG: hypothetical protein VKL59_24495 [Nostocaceae cyanobacterium]|nr:hypothetical protein [Nostocaceae cyanobacterium]